MHKLFFDCALLEGGWADRVLVTIANGTIQAVETGVEKPALATHVPGTAVPGVGNLHSHTFQRGFAGLTERRGSADDHFWTWRDAMYRFVGALTPDDVEAIAAMAFVEMVETGFTAVAEFHYLHHGPDGLPYADPAELSGRVVAAAAETGIGLTLLPVFYAHAGFGGLPPVVGQRRFVCDLDLFARLHASAGNAVKGLPIGGMGVAPHSLRAVTRDELLFLLAIHGRGPVHIHVAEQEREVVECLAATGRRPVDWLLAEVPVDERWCFIHATHMTAGEVQRFARTGAVAGLCPITESNLGDGIFPATAFAAAGGRFGVGSDSNVLISLPDELRTLDYSQRLRDRARNLLATPDRSSGRFLFDNTAKGGAQALGLSMGAIAEGNWADIVVLNTDHPALLGRSHDALLDSWVFAANRSPVQAVFVGGVQVVTEGRHQARDRVEARFAQAVQRLADI